MSEWKNKLLQHHFVINPADSELQWMIKLHQHNHKHTLLCMMAIIEQKRSTWEEDLKMQLKFMIDDPYPLYTRTISRHRCPGLLLLQLQAL